MKRGTSVKILAALFGLLLIQACGKSPARSKAALMQSGLRTVSCQEIEVSLDGTYDVFEMNSGGHVGRTTFNPLGSNAFSLAGDSPISGEKIDRAALVWSEGGCAVRFASSRDEHQRVMRVAGVSVAGDIVLTGGLDSWSTLQLEPVR